ncbi:MAG: ribonuclease R [Oscillospiraceae bacterium]|nr:ribonuclease R [Oscillospiraceae bacterium]
MRQEKTQLPTAILGVYQATSRGYGFLIPDGGAGREDDYFIPPHCEAGAWHGDRVTAQADPISVPGEGRRTARITAVVERANRTVTGGLRRQGRTLWLVPDNSKLPGPIAITGRHRGIRAGDKAAAEILSYGGYRQPPLGTLQAVFGREGSRQTSTEAILFAHGIDRTFPEAVLTEAGGVPAQVEPAALVGRLDLRGETIITIDGASAKDLDDAISLQQDSQGNWRLGVHIADVSHYVTAGSPLDQEALERGTSVYFADQVIPMLPPALSNGICSLNPQVDRLTLSCLMTLGADGTILEAQIKKSVIRSAERMTYEDCNQLLSGEADQALAGRYARILPTLQQMAKLAALLEKRRRLRGSLDLEQGECAIRCDETGAPVEIQARQQGVSERLIESFMLAANESVAQYLAQRQLPCVYRIHESPSADKTQSLKSMLAPLGYDLREADGFSLQKLLTWAKERPEGPAVRYMVLRALMKARYDTENLGHFGLAAKFYCHFTSPIRRYPDLMVHRILSALLSAEGDTLPQKTQKRLAGAAQAAAVQSSQRELAAQSAEREIERLYLAEYMQAHLGEALTGAVSGVTKFGLYLMLQNGVEGFLPVESLPGGPYTCDEARMTLSVPGVTFSFGMPLSVVCTAADPGSGQITFALPGGSSPAPSAPREEVRKRPHSRPAMHVPKRHKKRRRR